MNLSMKQKQNHRHREQTGGCQEEVGWGGMEWEVGLSRCKFLYVEWIKKMWYIYNGILLTIKKTAIMPFAATWMDLEIVILSEVSQKEKGKYRMISLIYRI